jgi:hypothetical protein
MQDKRELASSRSQDKLPQLLGMHELLKEPYRFLVSHIFYKILNFVDAYNNRPL